MVVERETRVYPVEGSLADLVFSSSTDTLDEVLVPMDLAGGDGSSEGDRSPELVLRKAGEFLRLNRDVSGSLPTGDERLPFRRVPSERMFGRFRYFAPDEEVLIGAYVPPLQSRPASVQLLTLESSAASIAGRLEEIGFPFPDMDPTFVVGQPDRTEGQTLVFTPGPEGVAELVYRIQVQPDQVLLMVSAERPPAPRYSELVKQYGQELPQDGTMMFEDMSDLERGSGKKLTEGNRIHKRSYE